jgi:protein-tyrosine phosphatase
MKTILFVCTANQFRSPIAAVYFTRKLIFFGLTEFWTVGSAGTWTIPGMPAHPRAVVSAAKLGLDLSLHKTREVDADLLYSSDLIIVMQNSHKEAIGVEFPTVKNKILLLGNLGIIPIGDIPDPGQDNFIQSDSVARLICDCVDQAFAKLVQSRSSKFYDQTVLKP